MDTRATTTTLPKVVILAGGFGSRISEDSSSKPKPMLEIGGMPILWHIMKIFYAQGCCEFVILCGYKASIIKEFFLNYQIRHSDVTFDSRGSHESVIVNDTHTEHWRVTLVDTGLATMTGGRIKRAQDIIGDSPFILTYGDGLADIDLASLLEFHSTHGRIATLTAVQPEGRFGFLDLTESRVDSFREKSKTDVGWINGGYMVLGPEIFPLIAGDETSLESDPLENLARLGQLMAYKHTSFWQCMDTPRDRSQLEALWESGSAPWKVW